MKPPFAHQPNHHPAVLEHQAQRAASVQLRLADKITDFAGSWPTLTLTVSLEAIFLSTFVLIGQNRQAAFQQAKADHDFNEQELELKLTTDLHRRWVEEPPNQPRGNG